MKTGVIVKLSQNALIGVAAFMLAIWWTFKAGAATGRAPERGRDPGATFPNSCSASSWPPPLLPSCLPAEVVNGTRSALGEIRTWWFALAFVCIGLETRFVELATTDQGGRRSLSSAPRPSTCFCTLLLAWLLFGGVIFPQPVIN